MSFSFSAYPSAAETPPDSMSATTESDQPLPPPAASTAVDASTSSHLAQYVLHPPLPAVIGSAASSSDQLSAIPLLLNPDILQGSKIPVITPQVTQVRRHACDIYCLLPSLVLVK